MEGDKCFKVLLCATGSVAAIKLPLLVQSLEQKARERGARVIVKVCMTPSSVHFCPVDDLSDLCDKVYQDKDEWNAWKQRGDPVLHIDLAKWAHLLLLAPLDANSLAKIANGMCDNLVLCCVRAWDLNKPLLYCPAMNTKMWIHPVTSTHTTLLASWGYTQLEPISKTLMCGDTGVGAMMEPEDIADKVVSTLLSTSPL